MSQWRRPRYITFHCIELCKTHGKRFLYIEMGTEILYNIGGKKFCLRYTTLLFYLVPEQGSYHQMSLRTHSDRAVNSLVQRRKWKPVHLPNYSQVADIQVPSCQVCIFMFGYTKYWNMGRDSSKRFEYHI